MSIDKENVQDKTLDISALAVTENHLYVASTEDYEEYSVNLKGTGIVSDSKIDDSAKFQNTTWLLYHSNDRGDSVE